ncbi:MAG: NAD(P)H-hydrate dehydratase [Bacteroidota bacterium]
MMTPLLTAAEIRRADQVMIEQYGYPGILLMETAGRKSAEFILERYPDEEVYLILAGPGNNGGDGLVIARYLHGAGKNVRLWLSHPPERFRGDAEINWHALQGAHIPFFVWAAGATPQLEAGRRVLLVDALLGTGVQDAPRGAIAEMIAFARELPAHFPRIAIDLPSGLNADQGALFPGSEPIPADFTLTFQTGKICHWVTPAANFCGEIVVVDIGIWPQVIAELSGPRAVMDGALAQTGYIAAASDTHKGRQGHALFIGGSRRYAGAIALSAHAALAAGAGLSTVVTVDAARAAIYALGPEVMVRSFPGDALGDAHIAEVVALVEQLRPTTVAIGPGLDREAAGLLRALAPHLPDQALILDADALNLLAENPDLWARLPQQPTLTPHPGEFRRLAGRALGDRFADAVAFAQSKNCHLILKGAGTITTNGAYTYVNASGNPGMATAGAGDVLTGILAALLAQPSPPDRPLAAALAVYVHGLAGDLCAATQGRAGTTASGIVSQVGRAFELLRTRTAPTGLRI